MAARRLFSRSRSFNLKRFFGEKAKKRREPKQVKLQTGPPLVHYQEKHRKLLFRFSLLCGAAAVGLAGFGYTLEPSFKLKTSTSPFSDEQIQMRLRKSYWYSLAGFAFIGACCFGVLKNKGWRQTLYNHRPDNLMGLACVVGFPACTLMSGTGPDDPLKQHFSWVFCHLALGMFFTSHLIVPGVLIRRGLAPLTGMLAAMALTASAAPNPWFMQYFTLFSGAFGLVGGMSLAHAFYGQGFRQFELVWHLVCAALGMYLSTCGVHKQIAHAAQDKIYDHVYYSVSFYLPLPPERINEQLMWERRDYSYRYGGEIIEQPSHYKPDLTEHKDTQFEMPKQSISRTVPGIVDGRY